MQGTYRDPSNKSLRLTVTPQREKELQQRYGLPRDPLPRRVPRRRVKAAEALDLIFGKHLRRYASVKMVGDQGAYSNTYIINPQSDRGRGVLVRGIRWLGGGAMDYPAYAPKLLIKVATLRDGARESYMLRYLHSPLSLKLAKKVAARCRGIGSIHARSIRDHIPKLYASGAVGRNTFVLVEKFEEGRSWSSLSKEHRASLLPQYEKVLLGLWLTGVVHGDLHDNNVHVVDGGKKLVMLDFGFAFKLPKALFKELVRRLCTNPDTAFDDRDLKNYVQMRQHMYGRKMMHWNLEGLRRTSWYARKGLRLGMSSLLKKRKQY